MRKLKVAWFSPLNLETPGESKGAYVSDQLLPHLNDRFELELFHDSFKSYKDFPTFHYLSAFNRHKSNPYDLFFYNIEDGRVSHFTRSHIGLMPGVGYLHDFLFKDEGAEPFHYSSWEKIAKRFNNSQEPWPVRNSFPEQPRPMGLREALYSILPIFSSERNLVEFSRNKHNALCNLQASYLPYPVSVGPEFSSKTSENVIAFVGGIEIEHRAHKLFQALSMSKVNYKLIWLINEQEKEIALNLCKEFALKNFELVTGRTPEKWTKLLSNAKVAVHTLFSAYGDPGAYLPISLINKVPAIVSSFGAAEFFPDSTVWKIQPGNTEVLELKNLIENILEAKPGTKFAPEIISRVASEYAEEFHNAKAVAGELADLIESNAQALSRFTHSWENFLLSAKADLTAEISRLWPESFDLPGFEGSDAWKRQYSSVFAELGWQRA